MTLNAWKNNVSVLNETNLNATLSLQDFLLLYEGAVVDSEAGSGVTENSIADYAYIATFTLTGVTELSRVELELDKDGSGADVTVTILNSMLEALKTVVIPKEFIPLTKGWVSVPIGLTGLTAGGTYYIGVDKAGDATNKVDWIGEASVGTHTCYRTDPINGAVEINALHFKVYSGNSGDIIHGIYGTNLVETYIYTGEDLTTIWRYCPPPDGAVGGIRDIISLVYDGDYLTAGEAE